MAASGLASQQQQQQQQQQRRHRARLSSLHAVRGRGGPTQLLLQSTLLYVGTHTIMRRGSVMQMRSDTDAGAIDADADDQSDDGDGDGDGDGQGEGDTEANGSDHAMDAQLVVKEAQAMSVGSADADGGVAVLVKTLSGGDASAEDAARLRYELRAFERVSEQVAAACWAPLALRRTQFGGLALLLPDCGGELLSDWLRAPRPLTALLRAALAIGRQLHTLHAAKIVLHTLMPTAVLYNEQTQQVQFLDFGRSSLLQEEDAKMSDGSLRSMPIDLLRFTSPESTGRANRSCTDRSDLYSFGCVLFALLQEGRCPFDSDDALTIVHQHLAQLPPRFRIAQPQAGGSSAAPSLTADTLVTDPAAAPVLLTLERVVGRLLAKCPEERYLSSRGVLVDLTWIEDTLAQHAAAAVAASAGTPISAAACTPWSDFQLAAFDAASSFRLSGKLYGRGAQVTQLMNAFDRVAGVVPPPAGAAIASELVLVGGFSGIGKTSIVEECQKLLVRSRAFFCSAKFDMYRRSAGVLVSMLSGVLQTILVGSAPERARWSDDLRAALGGNGSLFITLLPLLQEVIGPQPPLPALAASEREAIFIATFLKLIAVIAKPAHPLVMFLDDLQWSDPLSLQLVQKLIVDGVGAVSDAPTSAGAPGLAHHSLLIIGAYRTNEVGPAHPLNTVLEQLRIWQSSETQRLAALAAAHGATAAPPPRPRLHEISLGALSVSSVAAFVQDSFFCGSDAAAQLAQLLAHRCSGNPWFCKQVLQRLHADGLIVFQVAEAGATADAVGPSSSPSSSVVAAGSRCGRWTWDLQSLAGAHIGASVIELLIAKFSLLPKEQFTLLHRASILGNRFSLQQLAFTDSRPLPVIAAGLWELVQQGLILPTAQAYELYLVAAHSQATKGSDSSSSASLTSSALHAHAANLSEVQLLNSDGAAVAAAGSLGDLAWRAAEQSGLDPQSLQFAFAHDSIQQSAYSLAPPGARKKLHAKVARSMMKQLLELQQLQPAPGSAAASDLAGLLLDASEHAVAAGLALVPDEAQLVQMAELLLQAGKRAKIDTLWQLAERYLSLALDALHAVRSTPKETHHRLVQLHRAMEAECSKRDASTAAAEAAAAAALEAGLSSEEEDEVAGLEDASSVDVEATLALAASEDEAALSDSQLESNAAGSADTDAAAVADPSADSVWCWSRLYELSLSVHSELCAVLYHTNNRPRAEQLMDVCLTQTQPPRPLLDRVHVLELRLAALCVHASAVAEAIDTGMQILDLCGQPIIEFVPRSLEIEQKVMALSGAGEDLPECVDEKQLCVARTLSQLSPCAYLSQAERPMLMGDLSATILFHMLEFGTSGAIGVGLSIVAIFLWFQSTCLAATDMVAAEKRLCAALRMSDITLAVDARYVDHPQPHMSSRAVWGRAVNAIWGSTYHFKYPLHTSVPKLMDGAAALSTFGDASFLGHCVFFAQNHATHSSYTLSNALARNAAGMRLLRAHNVTLSATYLSIQRCALLHQTGESTDAEDKGEAQWPPPIGVTIAEALAAVSPAAGSDAANLAELVRDASTARAPLLPVQQLMLARTVAMQKYSSTMYIATAYADIGQGFFFQRDYSTSLLFFNRTQPFLPAAPGAWVWATWHLYANLARMHTVADVVQVDEASARLTGSREISQTSTPATARRALDDTDGRAEESAEAPTLPGSSAHSAGEGSVSKSSTNTTAASPPSSFDSVMADTSASVTLMSLFAKFCPDNWLHRVHLLRAEQMRCFMCRRIDTANETQGSSIASDEKAVGGDSSGWRPSADMLLPSPSSGFVRHLEYALPALQLYDAAISGARKYKFMQDEALANELAGEFCLTLDRRREAMSYLRAALVCWRQRGCQLKVRQLQERFPVLRRLDAQSPVGTASGAPELSVDSDRSGTRTASSECGSSSGNGDTERGTSHSIEKRSGSDWCDSKEQSAVAAPVPPSASTITRATSSSLSSAMGHRSASSGLSSPSHATAAASSHSWQPTAASSSPSSLHAASLHSNGHTPPLHELEVAAVMKAAQAYSCETDIDVLLERLMRIVLQHSSASRAVLLLEQDGEWRAELQASVDHLNVRHSEPSTPAPVNGDVSGERVHIHKSLPAGSLATLMPESVFAYLKNSRQTVVLSFDERRPDSASATVAAGPNSVFARDPYFRDAAKCPRSVLALPVLKGGLLLAILYLENYYSDVSVSFSAQHVQILQLLCSQAALSLENARFTQRQAERNAQLQAEVAQRQLAVIEMKAAKEVAESAAQARIDFTNVVSHEMRTPLNCVLVMSRLLADTPLTAEQVHFTQLITHSGRLLTSIISDVLDFSRSMAGKLELEQAPFPLLDCIESALHLCALMTKEKGKGKVDLAYRCDPRLPAVVLGDSMHLQQILINLVGNAAKYTSQGSIELEVALGDQPPQPRKDSETANKEKDEGQPLRPLSSPTSSSSLASSPLLRPAMLHFRCRDTGVGIEPSVQSRLFVAFEQADPSIRRRFGGAGLGLAICKQLVEAMHGTIELESSVGVGSEFRFCVQVMVAEESAATDVSTVEQQQLAHCDHGGSNGVGSFDADLLRRMHERIYTISDSPCATASDPASILLVCSSASYPAKTPMLRHLLAQAGDVLHVEDTAQAVEAWQQSRRQRQQQMQQPQHQPSRPLDVIISVPPPHHRSSDWSEQLLAALRAGVDESQTDAQWPVLLLTLGSDQRQRAAVSESAEAAGGASSFSSSSSSCERRWWPHLRVVKLLEPFQHVTLLRLLRHRAELPVDRDVEETAMAQHLPAALADRAATMLQPQDIAGDTATDDSVEGQTTASHVASPSSATRSLPVDAVTGAGSSSFQMLVDAAAVAGSAHNGSCSNGVAPSQHAAVAAAAPPSRPLQPHHSSSSSFSRPRASAAGGKIPLLYPDSVQLTIMIVEDNKINVKILLKLLERMGWPMATSQQQQQLQQLSDGSTTTPLPPVSACVVAYNGLQCLSQLSFLLSLPDARARLPSLLLLDVAMDGMDGLDCTRHIRRDLDARYAQLGLPPPYIIACTATASAENRRACSQVGMDCFLSKPLVVDALVHAIHQADAALRQRKQQQQQQQLQQ